MSAINLLDELIAVYDRPVRVHSQHICNIRSHWIQMAPRALNLEIIPQSWLNTGFDCLGMDRDWSAHRYINMDEVPFAMNILGRQIVRYGEQAHRGNIIVCLGRRRIVVTIINVYHDGLTIFMAALKAYARARRGIYIRCIMPNMSHVLG